MRKQVSEEYKISNSVFLEIKGSSLKNQHIAFHVELIAYIW